MSSCLIIGDAREVMYWRSVFTLRELTLDPERDRKVLISRGRDRYRRVEPFHYCVFVCLFVCPNYGYVHPSFSLSVSQLMDTCIFIEC